MKSAYRPKWKNPFFSYGSLVYETSSYPMSLICCFRYGISSGASMMTTVSPFFAEEFTFFGEQLLRTTSFLVLEFDEKFEITYPIGVSKI